jgi:peptidyl-prolyl cis-trans isomerase D
MLDAVRQNSRSAIVYILFGIIIAAFIVSFGPGSPTGSETPWSLGGKFAARVYGSEVSELDFHFAYMVAGGGERERAEDSMRYQRLRELIMDALIERELFAREAEHMGLLVSEQEAANMLVDRGQMFVAGRPRPIERYAYKNGVFDEQRFKMVLQNSYRITEKQFMEIQRRELLADKVRQLMLLSTRAAEGEVRADFEDKNRQINLEYVRFAPYRFEQELSPSETDIENYARAHEEEIKKAYDDRKSVYQKQEKTVHVRRILAEAKKDATPEQVTAAQGKIQAALQTIKSGTRFADVARTSDDVATRGRGGDLGWRKKGFTDFGADLELKIFAAKEGDLIGPERSERGFELIKVEGFREGDITLGQARSELAEELYRSATGKEMAKKAAEEAAAKLKAGAKLVELFPPQPKPELKADGSPPPPSENKLGTEETNMFSRRGDMVQGIGSSAELAKAVWKLSTPGQTVGPIDVSGSQVIVSLKERKEPDWADFDKRKSELMADFARTKWAHFIGDWSKNACTTAQSAGKIRVNLDLIGSEAPAAKGLAKILGDRKYEPCRERQF